MKLVKKVLLISADLVHLYAIRERTAFAFSCYKFVFFNVRLYFSL